RPRLAPRHGRAPRQQLAGDSRGLALQPPAQPTRDVRQLHPGFAIAHRLLPPFERLSSITRSKIASASSRLLIFGSFFAARVSTSVATLVWPPSPDSGELSTTRSSPFFFSFARALATPFEVSSANPTKVCPALRCEAAAAITSGLGSSVSVSVASPRLIFSLR